MQKLTDIKINKRIRITVEGVVKRMDVPLTFDVLLGGSDGAFTTFTKEELEAGSFEVLPDPLKAGDVAYTKSGYKVGVLHVHGEQAWVIFEDDTTGVFECQGLKRIEG